MSRRKQANPRAVKREEMDSDGVLLVQEDGSEKLSTLVQEDMISTSDDDGMSPVSMETTMGVGDEIRCDVCSKIFTNLTDFMEHHSSSCVLDDNEEETDKKSHDSGQSTNSIYASCDMMTSSNGISNLPVDQIPYTVGVNENNPYGCQFCDKAFSRLSFLKKHEQTHGDQMPFKCNYCQRLFKHKRSRDRHVKLHTGDKKYKCNQCEAAFSRSDHLKIHTKTHDTTKAYQCALCKRGYTTAAALTSHMIIHKKTFPPGESKTVLPNVGSSGSKRKLLLPNNDKMSKRLNPQQRVAMYPDYTTDKAIKSAQYSNNSVNMSIQLEGKPPPCPYCHKINFDTLEVLEIHVLTMHEGKPTLIYHCKFCEGVFPSQYLLNEHIKITHSGQTSPIYPCQYCIMDFGDHRSLQLHIENVHRYQVTDDSTIMGLNNTSINTLSPMLKIPDLMQTHEANKRDLSTDMKIKETCHQCNATFTDPTSFEAHMKMHGIILEKFSCTHCNNGFATEEQLEAHALTHYLNVTSEFVCTSCKKVFTQPDDLQKHLIDIHSHHLFRCSLCKELFDSKVDIQVHFGIKHSNTCKLYSCTFEQCGTVYRSELEWELHVKVNHLHISNPYRCLFCKERFSSEMDLQCHLTTHKKQFPCSMCSESFHVEFMRDQHMIEKHSMDSETSLINDEDVQVIDLSSGLQSASMVKRNDPSMTSSLVSYYLMDTSNNRRRSKENKNPGWLLCPLCPARFHNNFQLNNHAKYKHSIKLPQQNKSQYSTQKESVSPKMTNNSQNGQISPTQLYKLKPGSNNVLKTEDNSLSRSLELNPKCVYCMRVFKSKLELERHIKVHFSNNGTTKCHVCDLVFSNAVELTQHKLYEHCKISSMNHGKFSCATCKTTLESEEHFYIHAQQHSSEEGKGLLQCIICCQTLTSKLEMEMHGNHHFQSGYHGNDQSETSSQKADKNGVAYTCCVCTRSYNSLDDVVSKLNSHGRYYYVCNPCYHGDDVGDSIVETNEGNNIQISLNSAETSATCSACLGTFLLSALVPKVNSCHREYYICQSCYHGDDETDTNTKYKCPDCSVKFETEEELYNHMPVHAKTYSCIKCDKIFAAEDDIKLHVLEHIEQNSCLKCCLCNKDFDTPVKLKRHLVEHNFPEGNMACPVCNEGFGDINQLLEHVSEHGQSLKPHTCEKCTKAFYFATELKQHDLEDHSDNSTTKPELQ